MKLLGAGVIGHAIAHLMFSWDKVHARVHVGEYRVAIALKEAGTTMKRGFKVGDHVSWNSEAGRVSGRIIKIVRSRIEFKGYIVHASEDEPQFEIKSDKTDHIAMHKGSALRRLAD